MSNYTKTTDFEAKDSLPTGDSGKIIRGAEFETEFDAISTAIATKADTAGPTFTGTATFETISDGTISVTAFVDEDDMVSDSATLVPTQQSVKAYVDSQVTAQDLDFQGDTGGALSIDLDSETLTVAGGTGIDTAGSLNTLTVNIDSTVATLTGTQTLTNKTLTSPDVNTPDIDGGTIDGTVIGGTTAAAGSFTTVSATGNITVSGTVDGRDVATDGTKLDGIEALADVTDTANVTAAGALMDSELTSEASVKALNQGVATTDSPTFAGVTVNGTVEFDGLSGTGAVSVTDILDQDDMLSNSATALATQQSIKAYVDAQVATADALSEVLGNGNTTGGTDIAVGTGDDITFADSSKAIFGAGSDLQIYHDGSNSYITDSGTGNLRISGTLLQLNDASFNKYLLGSGDSVTLYNADSAKLQTTSTGIDVTGKLETSGNNNAGAKANYIRITDTDTTATAANQQGGIEFYASDATGGAGVTASMEVLYAGSGGGGEITFNTAASSGAGVTEKMRIDESGNVGIGVSAPAQTLHVSSTSAGSNGIRISNSECSYEARVDGGEFYLYDVDDARIPLLVDTNGNTGLGTTSPSRLLDVNGIAKASIFDVDGEGFIRGDVSGELHIQSGTTATVFRNNANNTEHMRIVDSSGNVGIGITNPAYNLVVSNGGASGIEFGPAYSGTANLIQHYNRSGAAYVDAVNIAGKHRFAIGATEAMRIDGSGNVGIGTSSPSSVLTVAVDDATGDNGARIAGVTDGNKQLRLAYNTTGNYANIQAIHAGTAYTNLVLQKDGGNVGVGTASPTNAKLEVVAASGEVFRADASGGAYRIVADQTGVALGGNVGIGTFSPSRKLHVADGANTYITANNTAGSTSAILLGAEGGQTNIYSWTSPVSGVGVPLAFTVGSEAMRIDSSGNWMVSNTVANPASAYTTQGGCGWVESDNHFEIATTSNRSALEVGKNNATNGAIITLRKQSTVIGTLDTDSVGFLLKNPRADSYISLLANNQSSGIFFQDGTTKTLAPYSSRDAEFDLGLSNSRFKDLYLSNAAYLDKVIGHDDTNTYISFIGSDVTQFVQGGAEAMRLNASGDLLLGVSSLTDSAYHLQTDTGGSTGAQINTVSMGRSGSGYPIIGYNCAPTSTVGTYNKHYVDYASWIQFISGRIDTYTTTTTASGTTTGTAGPYLSSGGTSWTSSSDRRLKDNIEGISYGLEAVKLLNPVSYVRNDRDTGATELGFIAQEVDEVVSEVVSVKDDGYYGIDYERLIPVLTKAIQDQQDIIENLKSRIEQLEGAN